MSAILQSAPGWLPSRNGCVTASHMNDVLDIRKDGKPGAKYIQYLTELVLERAYDRATDRPVTFWMKRGTELEPDARAAYEALTGNIVMPAASVPHPTMEWVSATPDGFIRVDGLAEFKVPAPTTYARWRMAGEIPEEHKPQMTLQLACTQRRWVDFCAFNPDDPVPARALFIRRFEPDPAEILALELKVKDFLVALEGAFELYCKTDTEFA
jgi:hypothetical protein